MGELKKKYTSAKKALDTFEDIFGEKYSLIVRDAAIQRFEYTFEVVWKVLKVYLKEKEGVIANSPKSVFREALQNKLLTVEEVELALVMTDDRNLTTHTYVEELAQQIFEKLPEYYRLMNKILSQIKKYS